VFTCHDSIWAKLPGSGGSRWHHHGRNRDHSSDRVMVARIGSIDLAARLWRHEGRGRTLPRDRHRCVSPDIEQLHAMLEHGFRFKPKTISLVWSSKRNPPLLVSSRLRCIASLRLTFGYSRCSSLCDGRAYPDQLRRGDTNDTKSSARDIRTIPMRFRLVVTRSRTGRLSSGWKTFWFLTVV
jgi:hypothetical protein